MCCMGWLMLALLCTSTARATPQESPEIQKNRPDIPSIQYTLEEIALSGNQKTTPDFFASLIGLYPGDVFSPNDLEQIRLILLGTGYFSTVDVTLQKGAQRGYVILGIHVEERNTILLSDVILGASRATPFWGGVDLVESNLFGRGLTMGGAFVVGSGQFALRSQLADPHAFSLPMRLGGEGKLLSGRERIREAGVASHLNAEEAFLHYERAGGEIGVGLYPLDLLGTFVDLGVEAIQANSDKPDKTRQWLKNGQSLHSYLRLTFDHDTRDNPLVPTSGYRLNFSIQASASPVGDYNYAKGILRTSYFKDLGANAPGHVLRFDLFAGLILGDAPFFERFYVGDISALVPSRSLGLNFTSRSSPDFFDRGARNLSYETMMGGAGIEYGVPLIQGPAPLYRLEFFFGIGVFGMSSLDDLPRTRQLGLAVETEPNPSQSAFPLDVTFDMGFRAETPIGIFGLSFANGLALVPLR